MKCGPNAVDGWFLQAVRAQGPAPRTWVCPAWLWLSCDPGPWGPGWEVPIVPSTVTQVACPLSSCLTEPDL